MKKLLSLVITIIVAALLFGACDMFKGTGNRRGDYFLSSGPSGAAACKSYEEFVGNRCLSKCQSDEERFLGDLKCYPECTSPEELGLVDGRVICTEDADEFDCRTNEAHEEICINSGLICDTSTGGCVYSDGDVTCDGVSCPDGGTCTLASGLPVCKCSDDSQCAPHNRYCDIGGTNECEPRKADEEPCTRAVECENEWCYDPGNTDPDDSEATAPNAGLCKPENFKILGGDYCTADEQCETHAVFPDSDGICDDYGAFFKCDKINNRECSCSDGTQYCTSGECFSGICDEGFCGVRSGINCLDSWKCRSNVCAPIYPGSVYKSCQ